MASTITTIFGALTIAYDDRVLRPRPWTVHQSEWAAELVARAPEGPVLELCCGAGQIGLLTVARSPRQLLCVDVDPVACDYTRRNADAAGLGHLVEVRCGRLEDGLGDDRFAVVIADPPWVPRADVTRYPEDPVTAIDGGPDGLDLARACLAVASTHLLPAGSVLLQVGSREQADRLAAEPMPGRPLRTAEVRELDGGVLVMLDRVD